MTGAAIAAMLEQMEPIELVDPEITDPVEWVETQRRKDSDRLSIRQRQRLPLLLRQLVGPRHAPYGEPFPSFPG
jgi:hypothetical protein